MVLDRHARYLFKQAIDLAESEGIGKGVESLKEGYTLIKTAKLNAAVPSVKSNELLATDLLILAAEAAVKNESWSIASEATNSFFLADPPKDQFFCRALFVQATVQAQNAIALVGVEKVNALHIAIGKILEVIEICMDPSIKPRYNFLVYNASVYHWNISRHLLRNGSTSYAVQSMERIVQALEDIKDADIEWRMRSMMNLVYAFDDAQVSDKAVAYIAKLVELNKSLPNASTSPIPAALVKLQVHVERKSKAFPAIIAAAGTDEKGKIQRMLQCCSSGLLKPEEAKVEFKKALTIVCSASIKILDSLSSGGAVDTIGSATASPAIVVEDMELAIAVAREAMSLGQLEVVHAVLQTLARAKDTPAVLGCKIAYLQCQIMATDQLEDTFDNTVKPVGGKKVKFDAKHIEAVRLTKRVEALKIMERTLTTCKRLEKPDLLEEGAMLVWNIGLPLLQPHLRKHVHRAFQVAATVLEDIESLNVDLRSRLHFEIGKCEVASDFLTKAQKHLSKAVVMDYGKVKLEGDAGKSLSSADLNNELRPLDKYMVPLLNKLNLKSDLYREHQTAEEQAMLLIEQASDVKNVHVKKSIMKRAVDILEPLSFSKAPTLSAEAKSEKLTAATEPPPAATPAAPAKKGADAKTGASASTKGGSRSTTPALPDMVVEDYTPVDDGLKLRTNLWGQIMRMSWEHQIVALTQKSAAAILLNSWHPTRYRDFVLLQAEAHLTLSETYTEDLKLIDQDGVILSDGSTIDGRSLGIVAPTIKPQIMQLKEQIIDKAVQAMRLGCVLSDPVTIENACMCLWNFHLHIFKNNRYVEALPSLIAALEEGYKALTTINSTHSILRLSFGRVLARSYEVSNLLDKAVDICTGAIKLGAPTITRSVLAILTRILAKKGKAAKEIIPTIDPSPAGKAVGCLALLDLETVDATQKKEVLMTAIDNMKQAVAAYQTAVAATKGGLSLEESNANEEMFAELWSRIAQKALLLGESSKAQALARFSVSSAPSDSTSYSSDQVPCATKRWYSQAECIWGQAIASMVNPLTQLKTVQDELRMTAMTHYCLAAQWGTGARRSDLVLDAAKRFWNLNLSLMENSVTRKLLFPATKKMLAELANSEENSDFNFRVLLYRLLFECYSDASDWSGGLKAVENAFEYVPVTHQKPLWESRMIFLSKLGHDVAVGISKMKESDDTLMAKVWTTLAQNSSNKNDQMSAYLSALTLLSASWARLDVLVEFAEWMHANHFPKQDVKDQLFAAVDMLMDVESPTTVVDEDDDEADDGEASDSRSHASRNSKAHSIAKSKSSLSSAKGKSAIRNSSAAANSRRPSVSRSGTKTKGPGSVASKRGKGTSARGSASVTSDAGAAIKAGSGAPLSLNIQHLEMLVRLFMQLSRLSNTFEERREHLLLAQFWVTRMWMLTCETATAVATMRAIADAAPKPGVDPMTLIDASLTTWVAPTEVTQWLSTTPSDKMLQVILSLPEEKKLCALGSPGSIAKVPLTLTYLMSLIEGLTQSGLALYCGPVIFVAQVVANEVPMPHREEVLSLLKLHGHRISDSLNLRDAASDLLSAAGSLKLTEEICGKYSEEVELREQHSNTETLVSDSGEASTKKDPKHKKKSSAKASEPALPRGTISAVDIRTIWADKASIALMIGDLASAKLYLLEAQRHNKAFHDTLNEMKCSLTQAKISFLEGDLAFALSKAIEAQCAMPKLDVHWIRQIFSFLCQVYQGLLDSTNAQKVCQEAIEALTSLALTRAEMEKVSMLAKETSLEGVSASTSTVDVTKTTRAKVTDASTWGSDIDASEAISFFESKLAEILVQDAVVFRARGARWSEMWSRAKTLFEQSITRLEALSGCPLLSQVTMAYAESLLLIITEESSSGPPPENKAEEILKKGEGFLEKLISVTRPHDLPSTVCLPEERLLATLKRRLGHVALSRHRASAEVSMAKKSGASLDDSMSHTVVDAWLDATAPDAELSPFEKQIDSASRALLYFSGAASLVQALPSMSALIEAEATSCIVQIKAVYAAGGSSSSWMTEMRGDLPSALPESATSHIPVSRPVTPAVSEANDAAAVLHSQAIEASLAVVETGSASGDWNAVGIAAENLVECYGSRDSIMAAKYLTLAQSCFARDRLLKLLLSAAKPNTREALFIKFIEYLKNNVICYEKQGFYTRSLKYLKGASIAWNRTDPGRVEFNKTIASLPKGTLVLVLQHSLDQRALYVSTIRSKTDAEMTAAASATSGLAVGVATSPDATSPTSAIVATAHKMFMLPPQRRNLTNLIRSHATWCNSIKKTLVDIEHTGGATVDLREYTGDTSEGQFETILTKLNELLGPALMGGAALEIKNAIDSKNSIVILADDLLNKLPLEGLKCLEGASLSRDFSLAVLGNRCAREGGAAAANNNMAFIVDPRCEDIDASGKATGPDSMITTAAKLTKGWSGVSGVDHIPTSEEMQRVLASRAGGGFFFYGPGKIFSHLKASDVAGLNLEKCHIALIVDRCANDSVVRRQAKIETKKTGEELLLEEPINVAGLLSLAGVNTVLINQWQATINFNRHLVNKLLTEIKSGGVSKALKDTIGETTVSGTAHTMKFKARVRLNAVVWGLPHAKIV